jgi:hypothetical protein
MVGVGMISTGKASILNFVKNDQLVQKLKQSDTLHDHKNISPPSGSLEGSAENINLPEYDHTNDPSTSSPSYVSLFNLRP